MYLVALFWTSFLTVQDKHKAMLHTDTFLAQKLKTVEAANLTTLNQGKKKTTTQQCSLRHIGIEKEGWRGDAAEDLGRLATF